MWLASSWCRSTLRSFQISLRFSLQIHQAKFANNLLLIIGTDMHLKEYQPKKALPEIGMFHRLGFPQVLNLLDEVAPQFCVIHALHRGIFVTFAFLKRSPVLQLVNRRMLLHRNILHFHQSTARSKFLSKFLGIKLLHFLKIQRTFALPNMFHKK